jgi:hypothetical protein
MSTSSSLTPPARTIDPRGQRLGAGVSVVILGIAFITGLWWLAALVGANLLIAATTGARHFLPGRPWPAVRRALELRPTEPEHEYPPRFAQALGGTFLALATIGFVLGATLVGWVLVAAVGALQLLLATTGICVGCRLYFLRWRVPSLFARIFGRADQLTHVTIPGGRLDYSK